MTMQGSKGIENPAFIPSSPGTPRRSSASPSHVEVSAVAFRNQNRDSQPLESADPQKSSEPSLPASTPPVSDEPPGAQLSELEEGPCGWRDLHPRCLQHCNTPQGFLLHYCLLALTQGKVQSQLLGSLTGAWRVQLQRGEGRCRGFSQADQVVDSGLGNPHPTLPSLGLEPEEAPAHW